MFSEVRFNSSVCNKAISETPRTALFKHPICTLEKKRLFLTLYRLLSDNFFFLTCVFVLSISVACRLKDVGADLK